MAVPGGTSVNTGDISNGAKSGGSRSTSSADRISKQFFNINGQTGAANFDLNGIIQGASAGFYQSIKGEQMLESGRLGHKALFAGNNPAYMIGGFVVVSMFAAIAFMSRAKK